MLSIGIIYSTSIILSGLMKDLRLRFIGPVVLLAIGWFTGYLTLTFLAFALGYLLLTLWMRDMPVDRLMRVAQIALWVTVASVVGVVIVLGAAAAMGFVRWQPGGWQWLAVFAVANLLNTVITEELRFRGIVQNQLARWVPLWVALLLAAGLFGIAHVSGGWPFVAVATLAGFVYGIAYALSGRLWVPVLVHWGLSMVHFVGFSYPMLG